MVIAFSIAGDPHDPAAFSGAPASLLAALADTGLQIETVSTELPSGIQRVLANVMTVGFLEPSRFIRAVQAGRGARMAFREHKPKLLPSREMTAVRSHVAATRLRSCGPVERVVQFGSEYHLPAGTDYITLDDATISQLYSAYPYEWMHAVPQRSLLQMIARQQRIFRGARACCLLNGWAARSAREDYLVPADRVHVVGTGSNRRLATNERSWDAPRFLFVGKDFERKNGQRVLDAFVETHRIHPEATLDIVGGHPRIDVDGVVCHGLLRLDRATETIRLNALFERATCLVLPSMLEPTGNVHAEALAAGIGSIGTTAGGVRHDNWRCWRYRRPAEHRRHR